METQPTKSGDALSLELQMNLLKKTQDIAANQVQALLPQPVRSANLASQGRNVDISA